MICQTILFLQAVWECTGRRLHCLGHLTCRLLPLILNGQTNARGVERSQSSPHWLHVQHLGADDLMPEDSYENMGIELE